MDPVDRTVELLNRLVSARTGILKRALLLPFTGGQIPYTHFAAEVSRYGALPTGSDISNPGASARHGSRSLAQLVFEAVERYCAAFVDYASLIHTRAEGDAFAAGARIQRFAEAQYDMPGFPYVALREDDVIHWALGRSLLSGERRYVPACFTFLPYQPVSRHEVLGPSFSTGMSGHWTRDGACLNGLLELVERDAFAITWMNRLANPTITFGKDSTLARRVAEIESDGVSKVTFTDLSTDTAIPAVCAVLQRPMSGRPLMTVGLSCKMDYATACDKALCEAISDHERLRVALEDSRLDPWVPASDFSNVVDFEWHGRVYTDPALQPQLDFLLGNGEVIEVAGEPAGEHPGDLIEALRRVGRTVSDVVMVDLTTRDMHELGVTVVKIFAPELVPLNADHRYPYLGHQRLHTAGGRREVSSREPVLDQFNPFPHPFS